MRLRPLARRLALLLACLAVTLPLVPRWLAGRAADPLFDGELAAQEPLARSLSAAILAHRGGTYYRTGQPRFDGQSAVAVDQMAILALGQIALAHPEKRAEVLPAMRAAADHLVDPATLRYAEKAYGRHAVAGIPPGEGHAYAGYINLALGMLRLIDPGTPHAALHDRLSLELRERLFAAPTGLIETYPRETWPPDVAVVAGSIGLHARATGADVRAEMDAWAARFERCAVHPGSGFLVQQVKSGGCTPVDAPRGSGTAIASYALAFAHPGLSRRLHQALATRGRISLLGLGGLREYPEGFEGEGDGNAGPILLGASVGATGFGLGAARMNGDREAFRALYRSAHLFGVPVETEAGATFEMGGVLGNALLLAMLTARAP